MSRLRAAARILLLSLLIAATGGSVSAKMFAPTSFTLANGLTVIVITSMRAPVVTQMMWYRAGSADEPPGRSGIAHYLEHLMFKGTKTTKPGEFSRTVALHGGRDNAFTTHDYTAYYVDVAVDQLPLFMRLEADRMTNLQLSDEVAKPELQVVLEERRMRVENQPASLLAEQVDAVLYLNHPYRLPPIGWPQEIEKLTRDDAMDFYRTWYAPNNATLVIAGAVTPEQVKPLAEQYFGGIPSHPVPKRTRLAEPPMISARTVQMASERVHDPSWSRDYLAPSYRSGETKHAYALQVLAEVLGGGDTSRLNRALVLDSKLATAAGAGYEPSRLDLSSFSLFARPARGVSVEQVQAGVETVLRKLLAEGVTEEEVARARDRMQAASVYARDSLGAPARIVGTAVSLGLSIEDVEAWPDRIAAVTAKQVDEAARAMLHDETAVTAILKPAPPS